MLLSTPFTSAGALTAMPSHAAQPPGPQAGLQTRTWYPLKLDDGRVASVLAWMSCSGADARLVGERTLVPKTGVVGAMRSWKTRVLQLVAASRPAGNCVSGVRPAGALETE